LAQALRDLDQRTSGIEKLPDGRTRFGDIIAGAPKALLEVADRAEKYYSAGDYQNALKEYQVVIKFFATVPNDVYSVRDSLPPATRSFYYRLAGDCAMRLKDFGMALEYAKKADELQAGLKNKLLLTSIYANMAESKYNQRNLAEAFPLYKQAIDLYEPLVRFVHTQGSIVGVFRGTNSAGIPVTKVYNSNDELYPAEAASGLYAEAAFSAFMTGHQTESLDYLQKATDLAPTNSFVIAVTKVIKPATNAVQ
jgi:tetratricopeptide (TPR) repeat protein